MIRSKIRSTLYSNCVGIDIDSRTQLPVGSAFYHTDKKKYLVKTNGLTNGTRCLSCAFNTNPVNGNRRNSDLYKMCLSAPNCDPDTREDKIAVYYEAYD